MGTKLDLVIVGAGWQGLAAAKTYLDLYPKGKLLVIDANTTIGGTWALENISPDLRTQNILGSLEYSWYRMNPDEFDVEPGDHIPANVVHNYLSTVAEKYNILSRVQFRSKVVSARPDESEGWQLSVESDKGSQVVLCKKLIVATGITSVPRIPDICGSEDFRGRIVSYKDLSDEKKYNIISDPSVRTVAVIGGSKAGHDAAYWSATAGKQVNWIVPCSGNGVAWMTAPSTQFLGRKLIVETLATTRLFSLFSPCIWGNSDGFFWARWLLHQTRLGRWIVKAFWRHLGTCILEATGVNRCKDLKQVKPDFEFQWQASSAGTLNYTGDFYAFIRSGKIRVHRKSFEKLTDDQVHFSDESSVNADVLIHCSGWEWTSPIRFDDVRRLDLGLPTRMDTSDEMEDWVADCQKADLQILATFPYLREAPSGPSRAASSRFGADEAGEQYTSWRLHRAIAPPAQVEEKAVKNLAFIGLFSTLPTAALAELQSLWAIAFLHDQVRLPQIKDSAREEAALWMRWSRLRYPFSHASKFMDTSYDIIPYFDLLLSDMGLRCRRKSSWWREITEPYTVSDYEEVVEEFKQRTWH
ncbi:hypothetical protein BDV30DRAFT_240444 [Aspergillus minisclerotigenes]|uniref:FAD/NAD(P)-binding domain-containing protein n=1 Tax=Aspergillus minisclerotigenes TaxID=656917 RepID=A0A5N6IZU6_9EURO|nr:hypothetical protein BDV30DRAFT_240444 [Aspergillus minisclerotigenes]